MESTSTDRQVAIRRRRDVIAEPIQLRGRRQWHLKDPLTLRFWQFGDEELFLWQQLDGAVSLNEWRARFERQFAPRRIGVAELQGFLGMLHREGLVVSDAPGQGETLLDRNNQQRREQWLGILTSPLAIRLRGLDPDPFLNRLYPAVSWLFHPWLLAACLLVMLSAMVLVVVEWPRFAAGLPDPRTMLTAESIAWLAISLALAKILHELGHALTCKHFGGSCHELGVMLLLFTPCLYCNVSDTWLVADKWRRMAVSGAGIWVELFLAACAAWLWWWTAPGALNTGCLNLMLVCSISTIMFNGNPLLRFDGYFMLSDWLEMPNLGADADRTLRGWVCRHFLGIDERGDEAPVDARARVWLAIYGLASLVYRVFVVALVLGFLYLWLVGQRLESVAVILLTLVLAGMVVPASRRAWRYATAPRERGVRKFRLFASSLAATALAAMLLLVPLPRSIHAPATLRPDMGGAIYVSVPGMLVSAAAPGTSVRRGEPIVTLRNDEIEFAIAQLADEVAQLRRQLDRLQRRQVHDARPGIASSAAQRTILEQTLVDLEKRLQQRLAERGQLVVRAPHDGVLIAPPIRTAAVDDGELPAWGGTPLDPGNRGCFLETGTVVGFVGDPAYREALVLIEHSHVDEVRPGQAALLQLDELADIFLEGRVESVASVHGSEPPPELVAKRRIAVRQPEHGPLQFFDARYPLRVALADPAPVPLGSSGRVRIKVPPRTVGRLIYDAFCRTFRLSA
jgi:putative peptide zinc metalloprotease protein